MVPKSAGLCQGRADEKNAYPIICRLLAFFSSRSGKKEQKLENLNFKMSGNEDEKAVPNSEQALDTLSSKGQTLRNNRKKKEVKLHSK